MGAAVALRGHLVTGVVGAGATYGARGVTEPLGSMSDSRFPVSERLSAKAGQSWGGVSERLSNSRVQPEWNIPGPIVVSLPAAGLDNARFL